MDKNTNLLTELLENTALIGDSRKPPFEFASQNAQELHVFLLEQGIPKALADKVVIEGNIDNIEALQAAINDGSIRDIDGLGSGKEAKLKAVVHTHPQADVSSTSEINAGVSSTSEIKSDPSNTVASQSARKPSVRRIKASRSTLDLVSQQKTKTILSRSSSMPLLKGGSNLLESSKQVKLLEGGPSSSQQ